MDVPPSFLVTEDKNDRSMHGFASGKNDVPFSVILTPSLLSFRAKRGILVLHSGQAPGEIFKLL